MYIYMYMYISMSRCAILFVVVCIYMHRCMHSMIYESCVVCKMQTTHIHIQ